MIWLTNKWGDTSTHSSHSRNANQPQSYFPHGQRPPREPLYKQPKPHHILIQALKRLAGSDKTSLTLTSTLLSVSRASIYTPNKTQDKAGGGTLWP